MQKTLVRLLITIIVDLSKSAPPTNTFRSPLGTEDVPVSFSRLCMPESFDFNVTSVVDSCQMAAQVVGVR